jgi:hypothetical protein
VVVELEMVMGKNDVVCQKCGAIATYDGMKSKGPVFGVVQEDWVNKCVQKSDGVGNCKAMLIAISSFRIQ